jgi:hypothetical protein
VNPVPPEGEDEEPEGAQPKRQRVDDVPLGIRKPRSPKFDPFAHQDAQHRRDDERDSQVRRRAMEQPLEAPNKHRDYEIRDGDELDRHLEEICSVNTLKELITRAQGEIEERSGVKAKPFRGARLDELIVFGKEAILQCGEEEGYARLRRRIEDIIVEDVKAVQAELDRKKDAYMKSAGR